MSSAISKDSDVHVTFEDQQRINLFARTNAKLQELKDEIQAKKKELQNLDDACDELLMVEDEEEPIPFLIGEVFVLNPSSETSTLLEDSKNTLTSEIGSMDEKSEGYVQVLTDLKAQLYAKFGTNINLEMEEES